MNDAAPSFVNEPAGPASRADGANGPDGPLHVQRIRALIDASRTRLTTTDNRILDALMFEPGEAAFLSAAEIARRARVHPASAVRLARKLGFDGYPALRASLQTDLLNASEGADRVRLRLKRFSGESAANTFVASEIRALEKLPPQLDDAILEAAARAIAGARRVCIFGTGHAEVLAHLLRIRLTRGACPVSLLPADLRDMAAELLTAKSHDVIITFALNTVSPQAAALVRHAREIGAQSILIGDVATATTRMPADFALIALRGMAGEARSLTVPMAICNLLVLQVARFDGGRTIRKLEEGTRLARKLERGA